MTLACGHFSKKIRVRNVTPNHTYADCRKTLKGWSHQAKVCNRSHFPIDCERPVQWTCPICLSYSLGVCGSTKSKHCKPCSSRWSARNKFKIRQQLIGVDSWVEMTLTRRGESQFEWDSSKCSVKYRHKHRGDLGCRNFDADIAISNAEMTLDYTHWITYFRRLFPHHQLQFVRVYEKQKRGLLHIHLIVIGLPPIHENKLRKKVLPLNRKWNFGLRTGFHIKRVNNLSPVESIRAINYLTKYLTKAEDAGIVLDFKSGEIRVGRHRRISYTRGFGLPMKEIKRLRSEIFREKLLAKVVALVVEKLGASPVAVGEGEPNAPPLITTKPITQLPTLF